MAAALVSEAEDEEVDDFEFAVEDVAERRVDTVLSTEGCPNTEDLLASFGGFAGEGGVGDLQSSDEISREAVSDRRWSSCQGRGCG